MEDFDAFAREDAEYNPKIEDMSPSEALKFCSFLDDRGALNASAVDAYASPVVGWVPSLGVGLIRIPR